MSTLNIEVANTRLGSDGYRTALGIQDCRNMTPRSSRILEILEQPLGVEDLPGLRSIWSQVQHRLQGLLRRVDCSGLDLTGAGPQRRETIALQGGGCTPVLEVLSILTGREGRAAARALTLQGAGPEEIFEAAMQDGQLGDLQYALQCLPAIARAHREIGSVLTRSQMLRMQDLLWGVASVYPQNRWILEAQQTVDELVGPA